MAKEREVLKVRVTYEPNRFSSTHLMDAYESIAPIISPLPIPANKPLAVTEKDYDNIN